ncbi:hypothetical protein P692DRAFT_20819664 [Suillus brevipes Sb2]|nr:hypothetical protein P692DRAFT_20819664 [Suillus brevipes Sb2]
MAIAPTSSFTFSIPHSERTDHSISLSEFHTLIAIDANTYQDHRDNVRHMEANLTSLKADVAGLKATVDGLIGEVSTQGTSVSDLSDKVSAQGATLDATFKLTQNSAATTEKVRELVNESISAMSILLFMYCVNMAVNKKKAQTSRKRRLPVTDADEVAKHASMLQGPAKTRLLNATSVPLPKRQFGPAKQRKESMLKSTAAHNCKYWVENAPTFRIPGVNINQLSERSKPSKADKAHSAQIMEEMEDWEPNAFSAKYTDEDGNLLAAYFSNRVITPNKPLPELRRNMVAPYTI